MKYKLPIRRIRESDLSVNCPHMPEEDDFDMYFSALKEDIQNIDIVVSVIQEDENLIIGIKEESDFKLLHSTIKDLLANQYNTQLSTSSGFEKVQ